MINTQPWMRKPGIITNKFALSGLILLCLLLADMIIHKSMSRVILPQSFSEKYIPVKLAVCSNDIKSKDKHWIAAVNDTSLLNKLSTDCAGFSSTLNFDGSKNRFLMGADPGSQRALDVETFLQAYQKKQLHAIILFHIKNLDSKNKYAAIIEMNRLKDVFTLSGQLVIESPVADCLNLFCDSGYFTSYQVPYFNPYQEKESAILQAADSIRDVLTRFPASAISCNYFQYPVLKKIFPDYPILTRSDHHSYSVVSRLFSHQLEKEAHIKAILFPVSD